jgi:5-methylcytosine-specific restriction endonuclease McrA
MNKICLKCNKEFELKGKNNNQKYCSIECKDLFLVIDKKCPYCDKINKKHRSFLREPGYCNNQCQANHIRQLCIDKWLKGESNAVSGKKSTAKYVKHYILNRDNHQCVLCKQGELHNNMKLTLELDHIDGNYLNNNPENLRILCPNCHTQTSTYGVKNLGKSTRKWD